MRFKRLKILFNRVTRREEFSKRAVFDTLSLKLVNDHPAAAIIIQDMVDLFISSGANNYLELRFFNPADMNDYTVLFQQGGAAMTPSEINAHLRHALEQVEQGVGDPKETAVHVLRQMGYAEPLKVRPRPPAGGLL